MQKLTLSILSGALMGLPSTGLGAQFFEYGTDKVFIQTSAAGPRFDGGQFRLFFRDGNFLVNPNCQLNGNDVSFWADAKVGCAIGSNALFIAGDANDDGVLDDQTYWETTTKPIATAITEPDRADLCKLAAAPVSSLPRPLTGFESRTQNVYYDTLTLDWLEYRIAAYRLTRDYDYDDGGDGLFSDAQGGRLLKDIVPGQYIYRFPLLGSPDTPLTYSVRVYPFQEAYTASSTAGKKNFTLLGGRWSSGFYQMDPRLVNVIKWQVNTSGIIPSLDRLLFSIQGDAGHLPAMGARMTFPSPLTTSYTVPAGFFSVGKTAVGSIDYERSYNFVNADIRTGVWDGSTRKFTFPIWFVDTYAGYSRAGTIVRDGEEEDVFPSGATSTQIAATADYDKDGFTNVTEFAMQSDPADSTSTPFDPVYPPVQDGPVSATNFEREDDGNLITITIQKRPDVGASLKYGLVTKAPAATKWAKATVGAAAKFKWTLVFEDETQIIFKSKSAVGVPLNTHIRPVATAVF